MIGLKQFAHGIATTTERAAARSNVQMISPDGSAPHSPAPAATRQARHRPMFPLADEWVEARTGPFRNPLSVSRQATAMNDFPATKSTPTQFDSPIFTILGGTTIPDRAAIVRAECREGSRVELRRQEEGEADGTRIDVWLECRSLLGLVKVWKKIGHVPDQTAAAILPTSESNSTVVAHGTVRTVYAPAGRGEAAVTVEINVPVSE